MMRTALISTIATAIAAAFVGAGCGNGGDAEGTDLPAILGSIPAPLAATEGEFPQPPGTYIGSAEDESPYVGIVVRGDQAAVYACDGEVGEWFGASLEGDRLSGRSDAGALIDASLGEGAITGSVSLPGAGTEDFRAASASDGAAGLYRVEVETRTLGSIVLEDASVRGTLSDSATGKSVGVATAGTGAIDQPGTSDSLEPADTPVTPEDKGGEVQPDGTVCSDLIPGVCSNLTCRQFKAELERIYNLYGVDGAACAADEESNCRTFADEILFFVHDFASRSCFDSLVRL